jgi:hypothetical protein
VQLAAANMAGRARAPAPGSQEPEPCPPRRGTRRHAPPRPTLELRDPPDLRGDPAHADRARGRHERPDDRAALRRRDRQLGRKTASRGGLDSSCPKRLHPGPQVKLVDGTWTERPMSTRPEPKNKIPGNDQKALCRTRTDDPFLTMRSCLWKCSYREIAGKTVSSLSGQGPVISHLSLAPARPF